MKRKLLAAFLGAVIFFIWSAVVHMNPATGTMGLTMLNEKEDVTMAALRQNVPQPGLYFFPGMDMSTHMSKEQEDAWKEKYKTGPSGLLLIQPKGTDPTDMSRQLVIQFISTLLCALIAAFILAKTVGSFGCRILVVPSLGLFSWVAVSIPQWNWYEFPFAFVAVEAINEVIGWLLAGLLMALMIRPVAQSSQFNQPNTA